MHDRIVLPDRSWLGYHRQGNGPHHIVFLHGFAANRGTWFDLVPLFPADQYTLHLLDLPPHGTASRSISHDYSILAQTERVRLFLMQHKLTNIDLAGHSIGGAVALVMAIREHKDSSFRINRLILIGAPAYPMQLPGFIQLLSRRIVGPLCLGLFSPTTIARKGLETAFINHRLITSDRIQRYATTFLPAGTARAFSKCARQLVPPNLADLISGYRNLKLPTLLIWGKHDRIVPLSHGLQLAQDLPNATCVILPDSGHNPHEEIPLKSMEVMTDFFRKNQIDR